MAQYSDSFYVTLPSNASHNLFPDNTLASYRTKLAQRIDLDGQMWETSLSEISYERNWYNIGREETIEIEYGYRSFFTFPFYEPDFNLPTQTALTKHLMDFLNKQMQPTFGGMLTFDVGGDRIVYLNDTFPKDSRITVSKSLCYFLGWTPRKPNAYVDVGDWTREPLREFNMDHNDGAWWVSVATSVPVLRLLLPAGYYSTPEVLINSLNELMARDVKKERRFYFTYNSIKKRVTFNFPQPYYLELGNRDRRPEIFTARLNAPLAGLLGFDNPDRLYGDVAVEAERAIDIQAGITTLFVNCDITRDVLVGDSLSPLLRAVQITGEHGDRVNTVYNRPYYRQLARTNFETIHIYLTDDVGEIIPFQSGRVSVTLHFRRRIG